MNKKIKNGFTLFELLVSISIIGILIAIASFSYSAAQKKARDARRMQDMDTFQKAAEQYYSLSSGSYPTVLSVAGFTFSGTQTLQSLPKDPKDPTQVYTCPTLVAASYCCCALLDGGASSGNSGAACGGFGTPGGYYCVKSQQ